MKPKVIVFASGTADGGGTGFENLVEAAKTRELKAHIVAVVSNHEYGGVRMLADKFDVPFLYFRPGSDYKEIVKKCDAEWIALSGWLRITHELDPQRTFNIHPALLSQLDGRFVGLHGSKLQEAVKTALEAGEIMESGFSMHFVTNEVDRGPVFFEYPVPLHKGMSAKAIGEAVRAAEHAWQPKITNMVVHGQISWDGKDPTSLKVPSNYQHLPRPKMWC